jgi:hypothetical protein
MTATENLRRNMGALAGESAAARMRLDDVVATYRRWMHLPDPGVLYFTLGAVAANLLPGDPIWGLVVGAPGSGKTEALMGASKLPHVHEAGTLTEASLLSGSPKRDHGPKATGGVLRQIGAFGIILCKDFGSVLSMHRDARSSVLAALREVYDGSWTRLLGTDGGRALRWEGKAGLIAGCTPIIDRHSAVMAAMGDRFILYRPPQVHRNKQAHQAIVRGKAVEMRRELAQEMAGLFAALNEPEPRALTEGDIERLIVLSDFATRARSAIERDGYSRDIVLIPDPEMPARLAVGLRGLLDGLDVIGLERGESWRVVAKAALDSVPALRLAAIERLHEATGELSTTDAAASDYPTTTVRRALEDMAALGLCERRTQGQGKADMWALTDESRKHLDAIRGAFPKSREAQGGTVPEKSGGVSKAPESPSNNHPHRIDDDFSGKVQSDLIGQLVAEGEQSR